MRIYPERSKDPLKNGEIRVYFFKSNITNEIAFTSLSIDQYEDLRNIMIRTSPQDLLDKISLEDINREKLLKEVDKIAEELRKYGVIVKISYGQQDLN